MKSPKIQAPVESEADKASRAAAEKQAETDRIAETQGLLSSGTIRRQRRFGVANRGQPSIFGRMFANGGGGGRSLAAGANPSMIGGTDANPVDLGFLGSNYYY